MINRSVPVKAYVDLGKMSDPNVATGFWIKTEPSEDAFKAKADFYEKLSHYSKNTGANVIEVGFAGITLDFGKEGMVELFDKDIVEIDFRYFGEESTITGEYIVMWDDLELRYVLMPTVESYAANFAQFPVSELAKINGQYQLLDLRVVGSVASNLDFLEENEEYD